MIFGALVFAALAALGVVLELLVVKKELLPGREDELMAAVLTL
jgi:hypothetical protein